MDNVKVNERVERFVQGLVRLGPIEFLGVATLLEVPRFNDEEWQNARDASDMLMDMIDAYAASNKKIQRNILKMVEKAGRR